MEIKSLIEKILPYAPEVATVLGGPYAGIATKLIQAAFGAGSTNSQEFLDNISTDPDIQAKLKQIDEELAQYRLSIGATDTENARQYAESEEKLGRKDYMPMILSTFLGIAFLGTLAVLLSPIPVNVTNSSLLGTMIGMLTREFIQACRFYIGGDGSDS